MKWKQAIIKEQGFFEIPKRWLHIHYYEALNILFRFENSLRVFVYTVLKNEFHDKWKDCNFSINNGDAKSIKGIASQRVKQAESFGYLGFDITAPLMHLTSGELVELITSQAYWPKFNNYFKGNKDIIKNKLLEIGTIRNSLAHFRPIKPEDIELIKQNSRHTLLGVESCLSNIFSQNLRVPTNTQDDWYKEISTLDTDLITTEPSYSSDESWLNIKLKFNTPVLKKEKAGENFFSYVLAKINTPNILIEHKDLTKNVTYISESVSYPTLSEEYDIEVSKKLHIVFRKDILVDNYKIISTEIKEILRRITEECDLLQQDNLARGKLVEPVKVWSYWVQPEGQDGKWKHLYSSLWQEYEAHHPDEYWGKHQLSTDIVAGSIRYPWMPSDISEIERFLD